ncbi:HAD-IIB family hydrolase [Photorhabdus viridis]|uniref:HAD-IIB family hydrolase n=1 Tax=Photorhabdus viridis TaxID=3163327 RepID=UPI0033073605
MHFSVHKLPIEFPLPPSIKAVVCCDLDETYIPFSDENKSLGGVAQLEDFLAAEGEKKGILLGWITGTNLSSALRKANGYISRSPNFLCCSLGTEFYWIKEGKLVASASWAERIRRSGYCRDNVDEIVKAIREHGISLEKQPDDYQGQYKISFYYQIRAEMQRDFDWIDALTSKYQIRVLFTKCNPAAGDPADCYDVEFIPRCCGKDEAVSFLMEETCLPKEKVFAFGDSANDFPMFARAGQGYLVANADRDAIKKHGNSLDKPYCHGILSIIERI